MYFALTTKNVCRGVFRFYGERRRYIKRGLSPVRRPGLLFLVVTNNSGMSELLLFVPICDIVRFVKIEPLLRAPWIAG